MNDIAHPAPALQSRPLTRPFSGLLLCLVGIAAVIGGRWHIAPGLPALAGSIAGYAGLVVLLTSLADRFDLRPSGAYGDFGRYFFGFGTAMAAFAVGLAATRAHYPQDLLVGWKAIPIAALTTIVIAVVFFAAKRTAGAPATATEVEPKAAVPPAAGAIASTSSRQRSKGLIALVLLAAAGYLISQRWNEHRSGVEQEARLDETERAKAPPWNWSIDDFAAGTPANELRQRLTRAGYVVYCPRTMISESKIAADNKANCWTNLKTAHGIPARVASFWFDDHGLTSHLIRFESGQWQAVMRHLDSTGRRLDADFGRSGPFGTPVIGWRYENGLVMSADSEAKEDITVLWTSRLTYLRSECAERQKALTKGQRRPQQAFETWWPGSECGAIGQQP